MNWVSTHADASLQPKAQQVLNKLKSRLSTPQQALIASSTLLIPPSTTPSKNLNLDLLHLALKRESKLAIDYQDLSGTITHRIVWPFALAYYEQAILLVAWCELRNGFRHFRADRIGHIEPLAQQYPNSRLGLHQLWLQQQIEQSLT